MQGFVPFLFSGPDNDYLVAIDFHFDVRINRLEKFAFGTFNRNGVIGFYRQAYALWQFDR
jgi:hypothetical protein